MCISLAPPWATIFYALHEQKFPPEWSQHVIYYKHFIDDVFSTWLPHPCHTCNKELWESLKQQMQDWRGLKWDHSSIYKKKSKTYICTFCPTQLTHLES
ncbi:hypothetical protein ACHAW6_003154 [Cyclotella cf. meneghiniana]